MLRPFKLPVELQPGHRRSVLARDLPACVFWWGFPDFTPELTMRGFLGAMDRWERHLLTRAVIKPVFTEDAVVRWGGAARRATIQAYLETVGFRATPTGVTARLEFDEEVGIQTYPEDEAFAAWVPRGVLRQMLAATAKATLVSPAALWRGAISELLFNCRVAMADELLDTLAAAKPSATAPAAQPPAGKVLPFRPPRVMDVRNPLDVIGVERA